MARIGRTRADLPRERLPHFLPPSTLWACPRTHRTVRGREEEFYAARDDAPFGERWELWIGEVLVTPAPHWVHQRIIVRLTVLPTPTFVRADSAKCLRRLST